MTAIQQRRRIRSLALAELKKRYGSIKKAKKKLRISSTSEIISFSARNLIKKSRTKAFSKGVESLAQQLERKKFLAATTKVVVRDGKKVRVKKTFVPREQFRKRVVGKKVFVSKFNKLRGFQAVSTTKFNKERNALLNRIINDLDASARRMFSQQQSRSISQRIALEKNPGFSQVLDKLGIAASVINKKVVLASIDKQITVVNNAPFTAETKKPLLEELSNLRKRIVFSRLVDASKFSPMVVDGKEYFPKSPQEVDFLNKIKAISSKVNKKSVTLKKAAFGHGIEILNYDKWYTKAWKGAVRFPLSSVELGLFLTGLIEKNAVLGRGLSNKKTFSMAVRYSLNVEKSFVKGLPGVPRQLMSGLDPRNPSNWFDIMLMLGLFGMIKRLGGVAAKSFGKGFVPSVRNAELSLLSLKNNLVLVKAAKRLILNDTKTGFRVGVAKAKLLMLSKLERDLPKAIKEVEGHIANPKVLKLDSMNNLVKSQELIKKVGKDIDVFHSTGARLKDLFGQTSKTTKSLKQILASVKKSSSKVRRGVGAKSDVEKALLVYVRRFRAVIGGGKAQNVFVKRLLTRKTQDYDILVKNHKAVAEATLKYLRKKFPHDKFKFIWFTPKGMKTRVYRIRMNGKDLADFDPLPRGLKPIKSGKDYVPSSEFLARRKLSTIDDIAKTYRVKKDSDDLRRLMGSWFRKTPFKNKVKDLKNVLTVRPRPKNMGVDRIKFGETHFFFDLTVPTGYAYESLGRAVLGFQKSIIKIVAKADLKALLKKKSAANTLSGYKKLLKNPGLSAAEKTVVKNSISLLEEGIGEFARRFDGLRNIRSNTRFTVIRARGELKGFPPSIQSRALKSAAGKLTKKQQDVLRRDMVAFIKKNPDRLNLDSKTTAAGFGESQVVVGEGTRLTAAKRFGVGKLKKQWSQDPLTGVFFDVIEVGLGGAPKSVRPSFRQLWSSFKRRPFKIFKSRFKGGDLLEMRKYKRLISLSESLTLSDYQGFLRWSARVFGLHGVSVPRGLVVVGRRVVPRVRSRSSRSSVVVKNASVRRRAKKRRVKKPKTVRKLVVPRKSVRAKVRARVSSRARKRARTKSRKRSVSRARVIPRTRSKVRSRSTPRTTPRPRTRVKVRPRTRPRSRVRPRTRIRPRTRVTPRPRPMTRTTYNRFKKIIPRPLRVKVRDPEKKKALSRLLKSVSPRFRPSLAAVIFDITAYKIPKSISGFSIRPVIIKKK